MNRRPLVVTGVEELCEEGTAANNGFAAPISEAAVVAGVEFEVEGGKVKVGFGVVVVVVVVGVNRGVGWEVVGPPPSLVGADWAVDRLTLNRFEVG